MARVTVLRSFRVAGVVHDAGESVEFADALARELVANGKATFEPPAKPAAPAGPMTTQSAAPIVSVAKSEKETTRARK